MTLPVYRADEVGCCDLGDLLDLVGSEGAHAARVKRHRVGERVDLVDGRGTRATCEVVAAGPSDLQLRVLSRRVDAVTTPRLVLVQALAKGGRDLQAVESACELGVDRIIPWQAERSIARWPQKKSNKSHAKWVDQAQAASKQSRRARWPVVDDLVVTPDLCEAVREARSAGALVILAHEESSAPLRVLLEDTVEEVWVIVGPEGGIAPTEVEALTGSGARPARLGPHIMRTSSAGPAALAAIAAISGHWDEEGQATL